MPLANFLHFYLKRGPLKDDINESDPDEPDITPHYSATDTDE